MNSLTPFLMGQDEFLDMLLEIILLIHNFVLVMLLLVLLMLFRLEIIIIFLMIASFFPRVNILRHVSKGDSRPHFRSKFCILLTLMISWVHLCCIRVLGSQVLTANPLGSKNQTFLSLLSYVGWMRRDGEHELWWSRSFAWSDWDTGGSLYPCS
jgi:hypothetical protein